MLTQKQRDLLEFIERRLARDGVPPSFDEMRIALDLRSKSGIHRLISALEERGFIRRLPNRARAIEIVQSPNMTPIPAAPIPGVNSPQMVALPVMGTIAAGVPIEAIQNPDRHAVVPSSMIGQGEHFALTVRGDSMIDAGILDGDLVIIHEQPSAENGDIIVALVEEQEATLKRLRRKGNAIALEAANPAYETRVYRADQIRIQGKLVGLIREY